MYTEAQINDIIKRARDDANVVRQNDPTNTSVGQLLLYAEVVEQLQSQLRDMKEQLDAAQESRSR